MSTQPTAIILAAGPGMGQAIAERFAREGFAIALVGRTPAKLESLAEAVRAHGQAVSVHGLDLSEVATCERGLAELAHKLPAPGAVIYNGGIWREAPPLDIAPADFAADMTLSVTAAHATVRAFAPAMIERGSGTLLFTGGGLALAPQYGTQVISLVAGKSALRGYALALHEAMKETGLMVGTVTITGTVAAGTSFDPAKIAESYWALHSGSAAGPEIVFSGDQ